MNRAIGARWQVGPVLAFLIGVLKWVDAYRLSSDIVLPLPLPVRVVLARYNLLAVSTHIYRGFMALKKPARGD